MISCDDCGKEFKYPCFLLKHLQRKYPCNPNKNIRHPVTPVVTLTSPLASPLSPLECSKHKCAKCGKVFKSRNGKYKHKKNVNCNSIYEPYKTF